MQCAPSQLSDLFDHPFDQIIDARSPSEFAEDHIPGAINLPVLDDAQRAEVGTMYKQQSPFDARKLGASLVFNNIAQHLKGPLAGHEGGWQPLVYCWRGGQRSGSFAWALQQIGWRAQVLDGGYRSYRRMVTAALYTDPLPHRVIRLGGYTGTAKTALLAHLSTLGVQTLDLEGLACHRGSLLGRMAMPQPAQKGFETALARALHGLDPRRAVVVEAESSKIGDISLPPSLWEVMKASPVIEVQAPLEARARYLQQAYHDVLEDSARLKDNLSPLRQHRGHTALAHWFELIDAGDTLGLCRALAQDHYDPAYHRARKGLGLTPAAVVQAPDLDVPALRDVAQQIAAQVHAMDMPG